MKAYFKNKGDLANFQSDIQYFCCKHFSSTLHYPCQTLYIRIHNIPHFMSHFTQLTNQNQIRYVIFLWLSTLAHWQNAMNVRFLTFLDFLLQNIISRSLRCLALQFSQQLLCGVRHTACQVGAYNGTRTSKTVGFRYYCIFNLRT